MRKLAIRGTYFLFSLLLLSGCGGESSNAIETQNVSSSSVSAEIVIKPKSANQKQVAAVLNTRAANASGQFSHPFDGESFTGNILTSINVSDPDGLAAVALSFNESTKLLYLCGENTTCPSSEFQVTTTGINPIDFDVFVGPLTIGLWVLDQENNQMLVDTLTLDWEFQRINGVTLARNSSGDAISLTWPSSNLFSRYNVFLAAEPNVTSKTYTSLAQNQAILALDKSSYTFTGLSSDEQYFIQITGINDSGESGFSSELRSAPSSGLTNTAPQVSTDSFTSLVNQTLTANVLLNDVDNENDQLTVSILPIRHTKQGQLTLESNGDFTYIPRNNFVGTDLFIYEAQDGQGGISQGSVIIEISQTNTPPFANPDFYITAIDTMINVGDYQLLINDGDFENNTLSVTTTPIEDVQNGTLELNIDGTFRYTPNSGFSGIDSFVYQVSDALNTSDTARVNINVGGQNAPPFAINDRYNIDEDSTLTTDGISIQSVLANDYDAEDEPLMLTANLIENVQNGQLTIDTSGLFTYIPASNFFGTDSFTYQISDGQGNVAQATAMLVIRSVNDAPIAMDDSYSTVEDQSLIVSAPGLLANDNDPEQHDLSVSTIPITPPENGTIELFTDGSFNYNPNNGYDGLDSFTYQVIDEKGATDTASVNIQVTAADTTLLGVSLTTDGILRLDGLGETSTGSGIGQVNYSIGHCAQTVGSICKLTGTYQESPESQFEPNSTGRFTMLLTYSGNEKSPIVAQSSTPGGNSVYFTSLGDASFSLTLMPESGGAIKASFPSNMSSNTFNFNAFLASDATCSGLAQGQTCQVGDVGLTPGSKIVGSISQFNFSIPSPSFYSNSPPIAVDDFFTIDEDNQTDFDVLINDLDADGDTLQVIEASAQYGQVEINSDYSLNYTPVANFNGDDIVSYSIDDGNENTAYGLITISVTPVNDAPVALDDNATVELNNAININALENDTDIDNDLLTISDASANLGSVVIESDHTLTYTAPASGTSDTINYQINDGNSGTANAVVHIALSTSTNSPPQAIDDNAITNEDSSLNILVLSNDIDADNDVLTVVSLSNGSNGTTSLESDNSVTYTPEDDFFGQDSFSYSIDDGNDGIDSATVFITINSVNDDPIATDDSGLITNSIQALLIDVIANDSDADGDPLTLLSATTQNGNTALHNNMVYFDPSGTAESETVIVDYRIGDTNGGEANGQVIITINNTWPYVAPDNYTVKPNTDLIVNGANHPIPTGNDSDINTNDTITFSTITSGVQHGAYTDNGVTPSSFDYRANTNFSGIDGFFYEIKDGSGNDGEALATIEVSNIIWDNTISQPKVPLLPFTDITFDGINYLVLDNSTVTESPFTSAGKYYAISNQSIIGSTDGQEWQYEFAENSGNIMAIASGYTAKNPSIETHIAVGGSDTAVIHQQYGPNNKSHWFKTTTGNSASLTNIEFTDDRFVALGTQIVMFTQDGITWLTSTPNNAVTFNDVTKYKGNYVIVGDNGNIETSSDGITWTNQSTGIASSLFAIDGNESLLVTVGSGGSILTSSDSVNWTVQLSGTTNTLLDVLWDGQQFIAVGAGGFAAKSDDGEIWSTLCCFGASDITAITSDGNRSLIVQSNEIYTENSGSFVSLSNPNEPQWRGVASDGNSTIVRVGQQTNISTSSDGGNSWVNNTVGSNLNEITYFAGQFISIGNNGAILTSTDGLNWAMQQSNTNENLHDIFAYSGVSLQGTNFTLFVTVGENGTIMTSNNLVNWQAETSDPRTTKALYAISHDNDYFVAVGEDGTILVRSNSEQPGSTNWMSVGNANWDTLKDVFYNGSESHIVGNNGTYIKGTATVGFTAMSAISSFNLNAISGTTSKMIAVGDNGVTLYNTTSALWLPASQGTQSNLYDIHIDNNTIHAVGEDGTYLKGNDNF